MILPRPPSTQDPHHADLIQALSAMCEHPPRTEEALVNRILRILNRFHQYAETWSLRRQIEAMIQTTTGVRKIIENVKRILRGEPLPAERCHEDCLDGSDQPPLPDL